MRLEFHSVMASVGQQEQVLKRRELIHRALKICKGDPLELAIQYWSWGDYLSWKKKSPEKSQEMTLRASTRPKLVSVLPSEYGKLSASWTIK